MDSKIEDGGPVSDMTLRDYFAGQAFQGMLVNDKWNEDCEKSNANMADTAYYAADAMLAARKKSHYP